MGEFGGIVLWTYIHIYRGNYLCLNQTNSRWAAEVPAGRKAAEQVAKEAGCTLDEGEIIPGSNFYHFSCHHVRRRSTEPHAEVSLSQLLEHKYKAVF